MMTNVNEQFKSNSLILVVDDTPLNLQLIGNIFRYEGYKFECVRNGMQALEKAHALKPKLVVLDILMQDMDGYEVCRKLKACNDTKDIPVVFLTAKTDRDDIVKGLNYGAVDYITKPFCPDELIARLNTHLSLLYAKEKLTEQNSHLVRIAKELLHTRNDNEIKNTQLLELNSELNKKAYTLNQLNSTKDKLLSILAHDLKGSFTGFLGLTELLNSNNINHDEIKSISKRLNDSAKSIYGLIENLLEWSKANNLEYKKSQLDLESIVNNTATLFSENIINKNIDFKLETFGPVTIFSDEKIITTILRNLISNAVKFTPYAGKIRIRISQQDNRIKIEVIDNGIGINQDLLNYLFNPTDRISTLGTEKESGIGLGLSFSQELAQKLGTQIDVASEEGKGSNFYFYLNK